MAVVLPVEFWAGLVEFGIERIEALAESGFTLIAVECAVGDIRHKRGLT